MIQQTTGIIVALCLLAMVEPCAALDYVTLKRNGRQHQIHGKLIVQAQDGGLLIQTPEGVLWAVQPGELVKHQRDERPFKPADGDRLATQLLAQLPDDFQIHRTAHYVIAYNTNKAYAQWCGALYERLYKGFFTFWEHKGLKLQEPDQPLVAIVLANEEAFATYAKPELGPATDAIIGYYSLRTNRVAMYDLTSTAARGRPIGTSAQITAALSRPEAAANVATIIHEATHQLAYNCGIHQRYADIPVWLSEGFAMYFETPDVDAARGWRTIGKVNTPRVARFRQYVRRRPSNSLTTLMGADDRFRNTDLALDAYAEAWALTFYLINRHPEQYVAYLKHLAEKKPLLSDDPQERLAEFREFFKIDLETLDRNLVTQTLKLRP